MLQGLQDNNPRHRITGRSQQVTLFISVGNPLPQHSTFRRPAAARLYLAAAFFLIKAPLVGSARLSSRNPAPGAPGGFLDEPLEFLNAVIEISPLAAIARRNHDELPIPVKTARIKGRQALSNRSRKPVGASKMEADLCPG